jgi:hypothetical protein
MDARFYFVLGSKLIGLYCLVLAVIYFVPVIGSFFHGPINEDRPTILQLSTSL